MALTFITLTHLVGADRKPIYINKDSIISIGDPMPGGDARYRATVVLSSGPLYVLESVAQVLALVEPGRAVS